MTNYSTSSYQEVADCLAELDHWLQSMNVPVGRIALYRRKIERLSLAYNAGTIPETFDSDEVRAMILLFSEIQEFEFIRLHLCLQAGLDLRSKLTEAVGGPELTRAEDPLKSTNHARNILFELTIAATLVSAGFKLEPAGICDLCTSFDSYRVFIECKRPQSDHKVDRAIKDGMRQLKKRLQDANVNSFGILAISVSKVITAGSLVLHAPTRESIRDGILASEDAFTIQHGLAWIRAAPPGVIAVLVHVGATGIAGDQGHVYTGKQYVMHPIEGRPETEIALAARFFKQFATNYIGGKVPNETEKASGAV